MTPDQRKAHERLTSSLPVTSHIRMTGEEKRGPTDKSIEKGFSKRSTKSPWNKRQLTGETMNKTYIIRHRQNAEIERLIEAKSRRAVEGLVLQDYSIEEVTRANASEAIALGAKGIKVEKMD